MRGSAAKKIRKIVRGLAKSRNATTSTTMNPKTTILEKTSEKSLEKTMKKSRKDTPWNKRHLKVA